MSPMKIDHDAIRSLAVLLTETDLTEIEIAEGDKRIRVTRTSTAQVIAAPVMSAANSPPPVMATVSAISPESHPGAVKSPMVGTVYLQSAPGSAPFITKGAVVAPGDTLVIIEAMKVMNPIKAEKGGKVTDILIDDAQAVEFGQVLVIVE